MTQVIEKTQYQEFLFDERQSTHDQSTSSNSKQSNSTIPLSSDVTKFKKIKRNPKSLLQINPNPQQRRGSQSCLESILSDEEGPIKGKQTVYTIYWYDEQIDHKYEIVVKTPSTTMIKDLIKLAIEEFNNQSEINYIDSPLQQDTTCQFELYIPKKKKGKPNEDFPAFLEETQLKQTNLTEFALKLIKAKHHYSQNPLNDQNQNSKSNENISQRKTKKKKSFWQKLFFCCNMNNDYIL